MTWIPIYHEPEDQLPDVNQDVLITIDPCNPCIDPWVEQCKFDGLFRPPCLSSDYLFNQKFITAWMSLPDPYKPVEHLRSKLHL